MCYLAYVLICFCASVLLCFCDFVVPLCEIALTMSSSYAFVCDSRQTYVLYALCVFQITARA